jgi:hypothetical protein
LAYPLIVGSGSQRALVVAITDGCMTHSSSTDPVSSVTYGAAPLTFYARTPCGQDCATNGGMTDGVFVEHWYLASPPSGTADVTVTVPTAACGPGNHFLLSGAASLTGVDPAHPIRAASGAASDGGEVISAGACCLSTGVTVPSAAGDLVLDEVCAGSGLVAPDGPATLLWLTNVDGSTACNNQGGSASDGGAPDTSMGWTANVDIWVEQAVSVRSATLEADAGADAGPGPVPDELGKYRVACGCQDGPMVLGAACGLLWFFLGSRSARRGSG